MSVSPIGSNPTMAALLQSGQPQPAPPATERPDDGTADKAATAPGTGQLVDKSA